VLVVAEARRRIRGRRFSDGKPAHDPYPCSRRRARSADEISERTRAALAAAKARGKSLGGFCGRAGTCTDLAKARAVRVAKAKQRATDLAPTIRALQAEGACSLRSIAAGLNARLSSKGDPLEAIDRLVPWESFRADIEVVVLTPDEMRKNSAGRKPIDAIVMFRMLILQALHNLSDEQVEYQVRDRLSFTRFP
jgi:Transposase domain (DUF772)